MRWEQHSLNIPANSTAGQFNIGDIPQLRSDTEKDIAIRAIEFFYVDLIPADPNGVPLATLAILQQSFLTLYVESEESTFRIPLIKLIAQYSNQVTPAIWQNETINFANLKVDWTKSYISTPTNYGNAAIFAFSFGVSYLRLPYGTIAKMQKIAGTGFDSPSML